jgi:hypothetical protein
MDEMVDDARLRQALAVPLQRMLEATMNGGLTAEQAFSVVRRTLDDLEAAADAGAGGGPDLEPDD